MNIEKIFDSISSCVSKAFEIELSSKNSLKFRFSLTGNEDFSDENIKSFYTEYEILTKSDVLSEVIEEHGKRLGRLATEFERTGSGWTLSKILYADIEVFQRFRSDLIWNYKQQKTSLLRKLLTHFEFSKVSSWSLPALY